MPDISVVLLHDQMVNKQGSHVTTSLTLIDLHDIARTCRTYGATNFFVAHPSPLLRKLAHTLHDHWDEGFGSTYNPNRKEALSLVDIVASLDDVIMKIELRTKKLPVLVGSSAKPGPDRISFASMKEKLTSDDTTPYVLMLGTGWGMSDELMARTHLFLEPIDGPSEYNHLSVRSACAIMMDRLLGRR